MCFTTLLYSLSLPKKSFCTKANLSFKPIWAVLPNLSLSDCAGFTSSSASFLSKTVCLLWEINSSKEGVCLRMRSSSVYSGCWIKSASCLIADFESLDSSISGFSISGCSIEGWSIEGWSIEGCSIEGCSISNVTADASSGVGFSTISAFSTGSATSLVFERFTGSAQLGSGYCSSCKIRLATGFSAGAPFCHRAPDFYYARLKSAKNLYLRHRFFNKIRQIHRFFYLFRQKLQILCRNQARSN